MVIEAPNKIPNTLALPSLFLAGSIEMGSAEDWQERIIAVLEEKYVLFNPRRKNWDSSWPQDENFPPFKEQVLWELDALEKADHILFYFDPQTKSPISLLELGIFNNSKKAICVCPKQFWRRGNVYIVCEKYSIPFYEDLEEACQELLCI